jgi:hypothetical protein
MATLNTDLSLLEGATPSGAADTWSRRPGVKATGEIIYKEAIYTFPITGAPAALDTIRLCKLPANCILIPHLCKVISEASGGTVVITSLGDLAVDGTTADNNTARYSGPVTVGAAGAVDLAYATSPAGAAGYTTVREMWLTAILGTVTGPFTAGKRIRFVLAMAAPC